MDFGLIRYITQRKLSYIMKGRVKTSFFPAIFEDIFVGHSGSLKELPDLILALPGFHRGSS